MFKRVRERKSFKLNFIKLKLFLAVCFGDFICWLGWRFSALRERKRGKNMLKSLLKLEQTYFSLFSQREIHKFLWTWFYEAKHTLWALNEFCECEKSACYSNESLGNFFIFLFHFESTNFDHMLVRPYVRPSTSSCYKTTNARKIHFYQKLFAGTTREKLSHMLRGLDLAI